MENVMNQVELLKFPSLENTYRQKEIDMVETLGYHNEPYIVTEKVHGANFSFWLSEDRLTVEGIGFCSNVIIRCAKRIGWIEDGEKFFNYKLVLEKYKNSLERLFYFLSETYGYENIVVYGELYGGNIQSGVCYKEDQDFISFDIVCDNIVQNKLVTFLLLKNFDIPTTPIIEIFPTLKEALDVNESFISKLIRDGFDGVEEHKESEDLVIEPITPRWYPNGSRVYFKKKTKQFLEKPNIKHKTK